MNQTEALVAMFVKSVIAQTTAMATGDHRVGNRHARNYIKAFRGLKSIGQAGLDALALAMQHPREDVRVMAAAYLLRHQHATARRVLEESASGVGLSAFAASEALKRWDEGSWQLDSD